LRPPGTASPAGKIKEFLELHYKAYQDYNLVAKFHSDRPKELEDLVAK